MFTGIDFKTTLAGWITLFVGVTVIFALLFNDWVEAIFTGARAELGRFAVVKPPPTPDKDRFILLLIVVLLVMIVWDETGSPSPRAANPPRTLFCQPGTSRLTHE